jgi:hypothetical protein
MSTPERAIVIAAKAHTGQVGAFVARVVKLADLADNTDAARLPAPNARDVERLERDRRAVARLAGDAPVA